MNPDLIFLHAKTTPRCNGTVDKYFEGYCTLQFIRRGAVELFYDDVRHVVEAPAFWTCYPGPHIRFHTHQGTTWHHSYMAMQGPGLAHLRQSGLLFLGVQPCPRHEAARCAALMERIIRQIHAPGPFSTPRAANLLESLLLDLAEWRQARLRSEPWLERLLALLEKPDVIHPDYSAMARQSGMALSTLRRRFRQQTGTALHRHVLELRMSRARHLVGNTELHFKDVAERLGYDNLFYFSRQFRQFHGVPPGTYRRSRQA